MTSLHCISGLPRQFGVAPQKLWDRFHSRRWSDEVGPVVDGRRIIPADSLPNDEAALREAGLLQRIRRATGPRVRADSPTGRLPS